LTLTFKQIAYGEFHGNVTFDLDFFGQGQMWHCEIKTTYITETMADSALCRDTYIKSNMANSMVMSFDLDLFVQGQYIQTFNAHNTDGVSLV
jgi:hypothetical protein